MERFIRELLNQKNMLLKVVGDLFNGQHQAYAHGVNAQGIMDAGIATRFKAEYPEMYREYVKLCLKRELKPGEIFLFESENKPDVFNLCTQRTVKKADPKYLRSSIEKMFVAAREKGIEDIGMPVIGCGLGRLHLDDLLAALHPFLQDSAYHITIYNLR